jgi:hypothetical protein
MKHKILIITLIIGVLLTTAWTQSRTQWEYKFENRVSENKANDLGAEGWELVAIHSTGSSIVSTYVFKRPK